MSSAADEQWAGEQTGVETGMEGISRIENQRIRNGCAGTQYLVLRAGVQLLRLRRFVAAAAVSWWKNCHCNQMQLELPVPQSRGHRAGCKWGTETGKVIEKVANSLAKRLAFFLGNDSVGRCKSGPLAH